MELTMLVHMDAVPALFFIGIALIALPIVFFVLRRKRIIRPSVKAGRFFGITLAAGLILEIAPAYYFYLDIKHGVSDYSKTDVLYIAAVNENMRYVKVMLKKGADPSAASQFGQTSVYAAVDRDNLEMTELMLSYGADPNASTGGYTPLGAACKNGNTEMAGILIDAGADPEYERTKFPSSLSVACAYDKGYNYELVKLLCDAGADKSAVSADSTGKLWLPYKYYFHKAWQDEPEGEDLENYEKITELLKENYVEWVWERHNPDLNNKDSVNEEN